MDFQRTVEANLLEMIDAVLKGETITMSAQLWLVTILGQEKDTGQMLPEHRAAVLGRMQSQTSGWTMTVLWDAGCTSSILMI